jgi:hypothetical protein
MRDPLHSCSLAIILARDGGGSISHALVSAETACQSQMGTAGFEPATSRVERRKPRFRRADTLHAGAARFTASVHRS